MTTVVGVRFKTSGRVYYFDPAGFTMQESDGVIVETARGTEFGEVAQAPHEVEDDQVVQPLKPIIRVATAEDYRMREQNAAKESDAFDICQKKIAQHGLDMKLVDVEYAFNGSKVVFYFTADERVDFRELVKDLASQFRTRIELRQIGVRDEAKMLGGLGSCGRPVCCKTFLADFHPVSIKMAKEQNLSLSPTKISGLCGRLMCCLQYEQAAYEDMKKKMPRTGKEIRTPDGNGIVIENNAITERTKVKLLMPDGTIEIHDYHYTQLAKPGEPLPEGIVVPQRRERTPEAKSTLPSAAYIPPEPVQEEEREQPAEEKPAKRRRRGGRGRGKRDGAAENTAQPTADKPKKQEPKQPAEKKPAAESAAEGGQKSEGGSRRRRHRGGKKPAAAAPQQGGQKPEAERGNAQNKPAVKPAADGDAPKKARRHRRGGANRKKPQGEGASAKE